MLFGRLGLFVEAYFPFWVGGAREFLPSGIFLHLAKILNQSFPSKLSNLSFFSIQETTHIRWLTSIPNNSTSLSLIYINSLSFKKST